MTPKPKRRQTNMTKFRGARYRWWHIRVGSGKAQHEPVTRIKALTGTAVPGREVSMLIQRRFQYASIACAPRTFPTVIVRSSYYN